MSLINSFRKLRTEVVHNPSFTVKEQLGYAGGLFGNAMGQDSVKTYSEKFCTDFMGIAPSLLAKKSLYSTLIGFFAPPIAGALVDKPVSAGKISNTRKIIMTMPVPFAVTSMLLFIVPSASVYYNYIWTLFMTVFFGFADSFYDLALRTLSLRMTTNPQDRKNFYTLSSLAETLGSMLPGWLIPIIVGMDSAKDNVNLQKWLYFFVALGFCMIGIITMYTPFFTLKEKVGVMLLEQEKPKLQWNRETLSSILHNRPFIIFEFATAFEAIRQVTYDLLPFLYENTLGDLSMKAIIDMISGGLSYVGLFSVPIVGQKISARTMLMGGFAYTGCFYGLISLFNIGFNLERVRKLRYVIGVLIGFSGMPNSALSAAKRITVADSTDYMEWYSEKRYGKPIHSDGMLVAVQSLVNNAISLGRNTLKNGMLAVLDYKPATIDPITKKTIKAVQSESTLKGILLVSGIFGMLGSFLPAVCYVFDNYTGKRKEAILEELHASREARKTADSAL